MDALDVIKVCLKRWYVMGPVVLIAIAVGLGFAKQVRPTYTASGTYVIIYKNTGKSTTTGDPGAKNPLGANGGALLSEALQSTYMSGPYQKRFGSVDTSGTGPGTPTDGTSYSVTLPQNTQSYVVQAWGHDPGEVKNVVDGVLNSSAATAATIQARVGAPSNTMYTTFATSSAQVTKLTTSSATKVVIAVAGLGVLAGASLAVLTDALLRRRRERGGLSEPDEQTGSANDPDQAGPVDQTGSIAVDNGKFDEQHAGNPSRKTADAARRQQGPPGGSEAGHRGPSVLRPGRARAADRGFAGQERDDIG